MNDTNEKILEELKKTNFLLALLFVKDDQKEMEYDNKIKLLDSLGLTQTEIGKIIGKDRSKVSRILNPKNEKDTKNK